MPACWLPGDAMPCCGTCSRHRRVIVSSWRALKRLLSCTGDAARQYMAGIAGLGLINYALNGMFAISLAMFTRALMNGSRPMVNLSLIHISEPTRLGMISYAVFCLKKKK